MITKWRTGNNHKGFRIALVQMFVVNHRPTNLHRAEKLITQAAKNGAKVVAMPEYFTCHMDPKFFLENKEPKGGPSWQMLSRAARDNNIFLFGGTIPREIPGSDKLTCTSHIFNPAGEMIAEYSKLHLFDVDLGKGLKITESDLVDPGQTLTTVDTEHCKIGVGVCLDLRYPELAHLYTKKGCKLLIYAGGFSLKTGPAHLEVLQRARAIDNQVYVANVGPATDTTSPYVTYGHSAVVDPWGEVISRTKSEEEIVYADIDLSYIDEIRRRLPIDELRRKDLYKTLEL